MRKSILLAIAICIAPVAAYASNENHFPNAKETDDELIELYRQTDNACKNMNRDNVRTIGGCVSRSIYGLALNDRGLCLGKSGQDNASMQWHKCEQNSLRFPPFEMPKY